VTGFLIDGFMARWGGADQRRRRELCGRLSGVVGVALNVLLGMAKVFIGLASSSVAVIADALNNLSDAAASVITLVGFKLAARKSDREHPFGHARIEYMTGVIVSALVIVIGVQLISTSFDRIADPAEVTPNAAGVALLVAMALAKLWLWRFNLDLSRRIDSPSLKATGVDARNDAISAAVVLLSLVLDGWLRLDIDGYVGVAMGVFVIYSGLHMVRETAGPLLGQRADPKMVRAIAELALSHREVLGVHDLIVHDYGPGHVFASVHIEVDSRGDIFESHALVDDIEREAGERLGVSLVGHMDPLDTQNPLVAELRDMLADAVGAIGGVKGLHDLRLVKGPSHTNVIFDVVVEHERSTQAFDEVRAVAQTTLARRDPSYVAVVNCDLEYVSGEG
jgi:cation diffusion facilitator family transporter